VGKKNYGVLFGILFGALNLTTIGREIDNNLKVLHLSFHLGCIKDFEEVAQNLGLDLTSWYILSSDLPNNYFDGKNSGNAVYNIGHGRANAVWNKHRDYFNKFDVIITSDTAPLSRIFLQNGWSKPLVIWICNRFDYFDRVSLDCNFPDKEYYELFKQATNLANVRIVGYTPYEKFYAAQKGINIGNLLIKPLGKLAWHVEKLSTSFIPKQINKTETIFVTPRLSQKQLGYLVQQCEMVGVKTYSGRYNGPDDLKGFKGVITIPYAWSTFALFENIQNGLIHFIPSEKFMRELSNYGLSFHTFTLDHFELSEWYCPENRGVIVYFDSWKDLKHKIDSLDFEKMKARLHEFGLQHRKEMLNRWEKLFASLK